MQKKTQHLPMPTRLRAQSGPVRILGRPGGMRGGAGGELKGGFTELGIDLDRNLAEDLERTFEKGIMRN